MGQYVNAYIYSKNLIYDHKPYGPEENRIIIFKIGTVEKCFNEDLKKNFGLG